MLIATGVAALAATVFGKLAVPPTPEPGDGKLFRWGPTSLAALIGGAFAGAMGYVGSALEEYGPFLLALAVMGPLTAAAWQQRLQEARVYRPDATSALPEEPWDTPT